MFRKAFQSYASIATSARLSSIKPANYGQPLPQTHSFLMKPNELTPGITIDEYEQRRRKLMQNLSVGDVVVCVSGNIKMMSQEIFYSFRQDTDFLYLTGFQEPDSAVVLERDSSSRGYKMTLFVRQKDPYIELWDGARTGLDNAVQYFKADDAKVNTSLSSYLKSVLNPDKTVYASHPALQNSKKKKVNFTTNSPTRTFVDYLSNAIRGNSNTEGDSVLSTLGLPGVKPLGPIVQQLRSRKSLAERDLMRQSGRVAGNAFTDTMNFTRDGRTEAQLAARFEYVCAMQGSERQAYVPVVASGPNGLAVHYTANTMKMNDGEMILMDAGCEYHGYNSDITRTWPVNGKFTSAQRDLYQAVLNVEKSCIKLCTESKNLSLNVIHRESVRLLNEELKQLGFDNMRYGDLERILYPHYISHPLGMDLHDTPTFDRSAKLLEGHVITIEPGLYVPSHSRFPKHFHGMGVRIEDDVYVGKHEPLVLTTEAPKEIVDVENACHNNINMNF